MIKPRDKTGFYLQIKLTSEIKPGYKTEFYLWKSSFFVQKSIYFPNKCNTGIPRSWWYSKLVISHFGDLPLFSRRVQIASKLVIFMKPRSWWFEKSSATLLSPTSRYSCIELEDYRLSNRILQVALNANNSAISQPKKLSRVLNYSLFHCGSDIVLEF